jgi:hypothetical protein
MLFFCCRSIAPRPPSQKSRMIKMNFATVTANNRSHDHRPFPSVK